MPTDNNNSRQHKGLELDQGLASFRIEAGDGPGRDAEKQLRVSSRLEADGSAPAFREFHRGLQTGPYHVDL